MRRILRKRTSPRPLKATCREPPIKTRSARKRLGPPPRSRISVAVADADGQTRKCTHATAESALLPMNSPQPVAKAILRSKSSGSAFHVSPAEKMTCVLDEIAAPLPRAYPVVPPKTSVISGHAPRTFLQLVVVPLISHCCPREQISTNLVFQVPENQMQFATAPSKSNVNLLRAEGRRAEPSIAIVWVAAMPLSITCS